MTRSTDGLPCCRYCGVPMNVKYGAWYTHVTPPPWPHYAAPVRKEPPKDFGEQIVANGGLPRDLARRIDAIESTR